MNITLELENIICKYNWDQDYPLYRNWISAGRGKSRDFLPKREVHYEEIDPLDDADNGQTELVEYFYLKQQLENALEEEKNSIYQKLFFISLQMKNFVRAEEWYTCIRKDDLWEQGWDEIQNLLTSIRKKLEETNQEHVILYWIDHLPYEYSLELPYLQSRRKHSVYFTEAYTVTPFTHPTAKALFGKINQMDDMGYNVKSITKNNSEVLRQLEQQGYKFCVLSEYLKNFFEDAEYIDGLKKKEACSSVFWTLLQKIIDSKEKTFFLAHALIETHSPILNTYMESLEFSRKEERMRLGAREIDLQLQFYDQLISKMSYRIFMSDHGMWLFQKRFHIHMQFYHYDWPAKEENKLFSVLDFSDVFCGFIRNKKVDLSTKNREYVPINDVAFYNKNRIGDAIKNKSIDFPFFMGYRGVVSKDYIYIRFESGYEWLVKKDQIIYEPNMFEDIGSKYDESVLLKHRKMAGEFPTSYMKDEKFTYSKYMYKVYDNVQKSIGKIKKVLNDLLKQYDDKSIALRVGAWHSLNLYLLLNDVSREKIGAIIDHRKDCLCARLGIPVYQLEEKLPDNISAILLSSYVHLAELKEEAQREFIAYEIVDIYEILYENDIKVSSAFFQGTEEDYNVDFPFEELV